MLKPLKEHGFCEGENGPDDKDGGGGFADTLSSFGTESVATAIAKAGGWALLNGLLYRWRERRFRTGDSLPGLFFAIPK